MATELHTEKPDLIVDLDDYRNKGVILLSGRPKGAALRQKLDLDRFDANPSAVAKFLVPEEIVSLNSSFFLGLFSPSLKTLGEDRFRAKYIFEGPSEINEDVETGIRQALRESNPLPN